MEGLAARLALLEPPIRHFIEWRGDGGLLVTLIDPSVPAKVSRHIDRKHLQDVHYLNLVVLHAVNELRRKGSHVPLEADTVLVKQGGDQLEAFASPEIEKQGR
ncbi:hypothetical protein [Pseudomonas oryzihabitans]|uniref:hypothetical protein n=1 Tax=Pseudomonas oryzihabitans TaxID=47885 RepID=UPI003EBD6C55